MIDSGAAAVSVLSEQFKGHYRCSAEEQVMDTYFAANGSAVTMRGETQVTVVFETGSSSKIQSFRLKCCIGGTSHSSLSTPQLVKRGWTIVQSPGETYLWHEESNTVITDVLLWSGTLWLRAKRGMSQGPALKDAYQPMEVDTAYGAGCGYAERDCRTVVRRTVQAACSEGTLPLRPTLS